jgi:hypothetical protein
MSRSTPNSPSSIRPATGRCGHGVRSAPRGRVRGPCARQFRTTGCSGTPAVRTLVMRSLRPRG